MTKQNEPGEGEYIYCNLLALTLLFKESDH